MVAQVIRRALGIERDFSHVQKGAGRSLMVQVSQPAVVWPSLGTEDECRLTFAVGIEDRRTEGRRIEDHRTEDRPGSSLGWTW